MISMEKIDYVINVTGASYEIVRKALLDSDGDVDVAIEMIKGNQKDSSDTVEAEVIIEDEEDKKKDSKDYFEEFTAYMEEIIDAVKEIWRKGKCQKTSC
jgi:hypothetical protein